MQKIPAPEKRRGAEKQGSWGGARNKGAWEKTGKANGSKTRAQPRRNNNWDTNYQNASTLIAKTRTYNMAEIPPRAS